MSPNRTPTDLDANDDRLLKRDAVLTVILCLIVGVMFILLLWDKPFPSPDFYSFAQASRDIAHAQRTESKYPPGLSFLLIPFLPWGTNAQAIAAQVLNVFSALGFALSLYLLCRHMRLPASSVCLALTLFNRYTIQATMSGTAHIPFLFLSTACLVSVLHKRWALAYALAGASTLFRYNGVLIPILVGIWHLATLTSQTKDIPPLRRIAIPALGVITSLIPVALWLTMGTQSAIGTYTEEIAMRGVAGVKAMIYLPATMMASFLDPSASQALRSAPIKEQLLTALPLLGPFLLGIGGMICLPQQNKGVFFWLIATLIGWGLVHGRFPEVGGLFFYAIQVTWMLWFIVLYGFWKGRTKLSLFLLLLPLLLIFLNDRMTLVLVGGVAVVWLFGELLFRKRASGAWMTSSLLASAVCTVGVLTAKATVYDTNYRPLIPRLLQFAESNPKVLVSTPLWMQLQTHGWDTSSLIPEKLADGDHLETSLEKLGVRFIAVGDWEVKNRDSREFWQEHEFFLGKEYKTSLRPYQLIVQAYEGHRFAIVQNLSFRKTEIRLLRPLSPLRLAHLEEAKR
jgi:hypothetical protein